MNMPLRRTANAVIAPLCWVALFSCAMNLIYLASPLYMMQVYDRVMHSQSVPTLFYLTLAVAICYLVYAVLDGVRSRILAGVGEVVEAELAGALMAHITTPAKHALGKMPSVHVMRDLDTVRHFAAGPGVLALSDLPWGPVYLIAATIIHPLLGAFSLSAAAMMVGLAFIGERLTRRPIEQVGRTGARAYQFNEAILRYADCARTMGLGSPLSRRWALLRNDMLAAQALMTYRAVILGAVTRFVRLFLQSAILGLGAWLAIKQEISGGAIFAGSLLLGRTLAPLEAIIGAWRPILAAKDALHRINDLVALDGIGPKPVVLPEPKGDLSLEGITWCPPGLDRPVIRGISADIKAGAVLAIVGPSAAGKSTLAGLITGALRPRSGVIRLDGADLTTWDRDQLGRTIGYLPQDVGLFPGTIRENIARFGNASDEDVIAAAKAAQAHDLITRLPAGYQTMLPDGVSSGQRQRIALARALLGNPTVIVMDEPNANLDSEGEAALYACVTQLKKKARTIIMITHRINLVRVADYVATLRDGQIASLQPHGEFLNQHMRLALAAGER